METSKSNFLIGLAIGSAIGALAQRFSRTAKPKMLKKKIHNAMAKIAESKVHAAALEAKK